MNFLNSRRGRYSKLRIGRRGWFFVVRIKVAALENFLKVKIN